MTRPRFCAREASAAHGGFVQHLIMPVTIFLSHRIHVVIGSEAFAAPPRVQASLRIFSMIRRGMRSGSCWTRLSVLKSMVSRVASE